VCIATPNGLHEGHALAALDAGFHVLIEKPMALTSAGCQRMMDAAKANNRQVFCVMQNRYSPPAVWLKEIMTAERLGDIFMVQVNCYWNRDARYYTPDNWHGTQALDGGTLFTQFSHFVDLLVWLFGDLRDIRTQVANFNHQGTIDFEDTGMVSFRLANGGMGSLHYSTSVWDANLESSITVIGAKGAIKVGGQYMERVEHCHIQAYEMPVLPPANPPNDYGAYKGSAANHGFVFQNVVDVLHGNASIAVDAHDGLRTVAIIEQIYGAVGK